MCKRFPHWPSHEAIRFWVISNDVFASRYARAKAQQVDNLAEEVIEISDNANADLRIGKARDGSPRLEIDGEAIQRSKLRADNRKWIAAKLNPQRYGDKLDVTSGGEKLPAPNSVTIDARVQSIMLLADARRRAAELFNEND